VLSYKFSFVCGQDLYLIRNYANKFDKHARKCVFLTNLYHILACASKSCKQNARCIGALKGGTHEQTCLSYMYARTCLSKSASNTTDLHTIEHVLRHHSLDINQPVHTFSLLPSKNDVRRVVFDGSGVRYYHS
jgi:hypothetical protein